VGTKADVVTLGVAPQIRSTGEIPAAQPYHSWKKEFMRTMERDYLVEQLRNYEGNVSALARAMKVSRPNLCRLLKKHGLAADSFRKAA
jgi:DNA-binding NtrC family response regulator